MPGLVKVMHGADGVAMYDAISTALRDEPGGKVNDDLARQL